MRVVLARARRRRIAVPAMAVALIALGCGAIASAADRSPVRAPRRSATARVQISDFAFHPHTLHVPPGATIAFVNGDSTAHTATETHGFATGRIRPGQAATVKLGRAGVYAYHCTIHPFMHGKVVVG